MGRIVVITGASKGIGLAICERFVAAGDTVFGIARGREALGQAEKVLGESGHFRGLNADVTEPAHIEEVFTTISGFEGRIDVLVNNASLVIESPFHELSLSDWHLSLDVNLTGAFLCSKAAIALFPQGGGHIVNISSLAAWNGSVNQTALAASKGGLDAFTRALAAELEPSGIAVDAIAPDPDKPQSPQEFAAAVFDLIASQGRES